MWKVN
ncbi:hypothetical protein RDI58_003849 [Solanum bulbocastanum]